MTATMVLVCVFLTVFVIIFGPVFMMCALLWWTDPLRDERRNRLRAKWRFFWARIAARLKKPVVCKHEHVLDYRCGRYYCEDCRRWIGAESAEGARIIIRMPRRTLLDKVRKV